MRRSVIATVFTAVLITVLGGAALGQHPHHPADSMPAVTGPHATMDELHRHGGVPAGWRFTLPAGDAQAGKEVFRRFECDSCHTAGPDFSTPRAEPGHAGPDLTGMGPHHPTEYFAESIIAPNAVIVDGPGYTGPDGRSIMPDFRDSMTVADLVNVVAYLRSLGSAPADGHDHMTMEMDDAHEQTVDGLRVRVDYDDPDEQGIPTGRLKVNVTDAKSGQPIPYLPLQVTIQRAEGKPRVVRLTPTLDDAGFHYVADTTLPDDIERVVIRIAPSTLRVRGAAPRLDRARTVTIPWNG